MKVQEIFQGTFKLISIVGHKSQMIFPLEIKEYVGRSIIQRSQPKGFEPK